jgi:hypothetical protein
MGFPREALKTVASTQWRFDRRRNLILPRAPLLLPPYYALAQARLSARFALPPTDGGEE